MKSTGRTTSTHYASPSRPLAARLFNRLGPLAAGAPLDADELVQRARTSAGLDDLGDDSFREPLGRLVRAIESEARLNPLGRRIMGGRLVSLLESRLRLVAFAEAHPELNSLQLQRPIVIAGLQRTGTTMLHRLLAADPRTRSLASWEALAPTPLPGEGDRGSHRRKRAAKLAEVGLRTLSPEFFAIHPVEADAPEEDVLLMDLSFTSQAPEATLHVPSYARWLESQDLEPSYRFLKTALQALQWQQPNERWVLKTPHHMEYLRPLLAVFPDAVIVQTHRDPQSTMPSFCSMVSHGRGIFSDEVDPREVGRHWLRKVRRMIDRSLEVRDQGASGSFIDVSYEGLLRDPIAEVERVYAFAGVEMTPAARAAMVAVKQRDVQHRYGRHVYRAWDFGLSRSLVEETFADYRARFGIPSERGEKRAKKPAEPAVEKDLGVGTTNPALAVASGLLSLLEAQDALCPLGPEYRLDGKTALVTGANVGLGRAVAIDLARRGARVFVAGRSGIPQAGEEIARIAGVASVEMLKVDLSDLDSVVALTDALSSRGERLDLLVCNAGVMPAHSTPSAQGFELMYAVHVFANALLVHRLLASGVLANSVFAKNGAAGRDVPRVVFVASEAHRSSRGVDIDRLGELTPYGVADGMRHYGDSKLALITYATELSRRLTTADGPTVSVHSLCPGPVATRLARNAPPLLQPLIDPIMQRAFASPEVAAAPVSLLCAAPEVAGDTGWYLHRLQRKDPSRWTLDPEHGRKLWEHLESTLARWIDAPISAPAARS
jgi:NAD(P)-dependent dehydrogenase (short-subunit alcohol dehydrogenase family)